MKAKLALVLAVSAIVCAAGANRAAADPRHHFVPNSLGFWDFSKNWTTNYGPAYRNVVIDGRTNFLACTSQFALCFHSGPRPLPCKLTEGGRFANCTCEVMSGTNFVLITAILNRHVYDKTVDQCKADGSDCTGVDVAPVCQYLDQGKLIPGAELISTYDPSSTSAIQDDATPLKNCDGPFAGCMTAPCTFKKDGLAECSCPVFYGRFQLVGADAQCDLGGNLVPSASYNPSHDPTVP